MAFPLKDRVSDPHKGRHPCDGTKPPDVLRARSVRQRASGNERGKSACGLAQERRALRSAKRGTERVLQKFPLIIQLLLIVTRMGRDYRPGPRSGQSRSPATAAMLNIQAALANHFSNSRGRISRILPEGIS